MISFYLGNCSIKPDSRKILKQLEIYLKLIGQPYEYWGSDKLWISRDNSYWISRDNSYDINKAQNIALVEEFCNIFELKYKIYAVS